MTLAELRALAEAATHGPWRVTSSDDNDETMLLAVATDAARDMTIAITDQWKGLKQAKADAAYIAATSPDLILAMLDVCKAAQTRAAWPRKLDTALTALAEKMERLP